jgi:biopolymer transport protein TolR
MAGRHRLRTRSGRSRLDPMPDITPIVNVALVLLVIFMIVMPIIREGIEVETPDADHADQMEDAAEHRVVLSIQADRKMFVNLVPVDDASIKSELARAYRGQEGAPVIIKGAKNLPYQDILALMEICQGIGAPAVDLMAKQGE